MFGVAVSPSSSRVYS